MRPLAAPAAPSEDHLVAAISDALGEQQRPLRVGIGDDAAAWKPAAHHLSLITTDMLVDGVHFRLEATPAEALGHKALAENLSDIAAMGGVPVVAVVALGLPETIGVDWIRAFYRGVAQLGKSARCALAGGDISRAPALTIAVTVVGQVRRSRLKTRSAARPGDSIVLSGALGLSAAGLLLQEDGHSDLDSTDWELAARAAYLTPTPRLKEGRYLGATQAVHAMMDISDGLSTDLARMAAASCVDAVIYRPALPMDPAVEAAARRFERDPLDLVLHGGDDYELLAAVQFRSAGHVSRGCKHRCGRPLITVGRFAAGSGRVWLEGQDGRTQIVPAGYDHLRAKHS